MTSQAVIGKPKFGIGLAAILREVGWLSKLGREMSSTDGSAEDLRARQFRRRTAVLLTVITATSVRMVASGGPLIVVASSPADHLMVSLHLALVAEAVEQQGDPVGYRCPSELGTYRGLPILSRQCHGKVQGASAPLRGGTFGLLYHDSLKEVLELTADLLPLRGRGLGHRLD